MGRKIPAKKHRGVKDPLVQQQRRLQSLKSKINAPPKDPDEQPVPRSLLRLFAFENKDTTKKQIKRKIVPRKQADHNENRNNPISCLRKLPGESGRSFSLRINSAMRALHTEANPESYPQDMEDEDIKGQVMADHRQRREKKRRRAGAQSNTSAGPTRAERLALKKQEKLEREKQKLADKSEIQHERVAFGEVAHAPPALKLKHRTPNSHRPGQRDLLLTRLLKPSSEMDANAQRTRNAALTADQQRRERARLDAVDAYRALKAAKHKNKPNKV